ncbi:MAG: hypothetical protein NZ750_09705 [Anaerolineae bacterium]|nr:hypothetical protein [Anaerolineae bacterium]MDW8171895.1 hypothetical protein [Anaerolineae bacterium]
MAIDFIIGYDCVPKRVLTDAGIQERLKANERAQLIIRLYREAGDDRPPSQMGFELTHRTPQGETTELIVVQNLLDMAQPLTEHAHHCQGCPANRNNHAYGCMGFIQYPISGQAERWLLNQLPTQREALVYLLLKQGIDDFAYDGQTILPLRLNDVYFEERVPALRRLGEFDINANQVFEMIFGVGDVQPNHAAILLLFFNAIERDLQADEIMNLHPAPADADERFPFLHQPMPQDDATTAELKDFFHALYLAWRLGVALKVEA